MSALDEWEAYADQFYRDTGFMRAGKDDARGCHTHEERSAAFDAWWKMRKKIEALVAERRADDGWISCAERMPEMRERVLLWRGDNQRVGYWSDSSGISWWIDGTGHEPTEASYVTHWRPLPAPPAADTRNQGANDARG